jgi:hypothetical protein
MYQDGFNSIQKSSRLFEVAPALVRFDHVVRFILNANHGVM